MNQNGGDPTLWEMAKSVIGAPFHERVLRQRQAQNDALREEAANWFLEQTVKIARDDNDEFTIPLGDLESIRTPTSEQITDFRDASTKAVHSNTHAAGYLRTLSRFVLGKGPTLTPIIKGREDDEELNERLQAFWKVFRKVNRWDHKEKELAWRLWRDGEYFARDFVHEFDGPLVDPDAPVDQVTAQRLSELGISPDELVAKMPEVKAGMTTLRFVAPEHIRDPLGKVSHGIITAAGDVETILGYMFSPSGKGNDVEVIPASDMMHLKIGTDSDVKRGRPILTGMMKNLKRFEDWMDYRIALNLARTAVVLVKKFDSATPAQIQSIRDAQETARENPHNRNQIKRLRPNTTIHTSKGVGYEYLSPNLQAQDAQHDGRSILLTLAVQAGLPEYMFTGDSSNSNFASTLVSESPALREFEFWQDFLDPAYGEVMQRTYMNGVEHSAELLKGLSEEDIADMQIDVTYSPLLSRDERAHTDRNKVLNEAGLLSLEGWAADEGLDWATEKIRVDNEREERMARMPTMTPQRQDGDESQTPDNDEDGDDE